MHSEQTARGVTALVDGASTVRCVHEWPQDKLSGVSKKLQHMAQRAASSSWRASGSDSGQSLTSASAALDMLWRHDV